MLSQKWGTKNCADDVVHLRVVVINQTMMNKINTTTFVFIFPSKSNHSAIELILFLFNPFLLEVASRIRTFKA